MLLAGDALVRGAVNLALRLGIPALIVSLTIVSLGTSAPELFIGVDAVLEGAPGLAIGNVVGSNTANVLLVLGLPAMVAAIYCANLETARSYGHMMIATIVFIALCFVGPFTWISGLILLALLALIIGDQIRDARAHMKANEDVEVEGADPSMRAWKITAFLIAGLIGLPLGAKLFVTSAVNIATAIGVSETVIGLTLVAIGTSLPELATTVMAALRRQADVALGNVIGSNIFNILGIIGVASLFGTIPVAADFLRFDLWVMLAASLLLAPFVLWRLDITRPVGAVLTAVYIGYILVVLV